jgi:hypothetical protein
MHFVRFSRYRLRPEETEFHRDGQFHEFKGVRVEAPQDVEAAVQEVLEHDGPALLDVVGARQELVVPPMTSIDEAHKFGMFMLKSSTRKSRSFAPQVTCCSKYGLTPPTASSSSRLSICFRFSWFSRWAP